MRTSGNRQRMQKSGGKENHEISSRSIMQFSEMNRMSRRGFSDSGEKDGDAFFAPPTRTTSMMQRLPSERKFNQSTRSILEFCSMNHISTRHIAEETGNDSHHGKNGTSGNNMQNHGRVSPRLACSPQRMLSLRPGRKVSEKQIVPNETRKKDIKTVAITPNRSPNVVIDRLPFERDYRSGHDELNNDRFYNERTQEVDRLVSFENTDVLPPIICSSNCSNDSDSTLSYEESYAEDFCVPQGLFERPMVTVAIGFNVPFVGLEETTYASHLGHVKLISCTLCTTTSLFYDEATLTACPVCSAISPVDMPVINNRKCGMPNNFAPLLGLGIPPYDN